jgi:hypothetical protein
MKTSSTALPVAQFTNSFHRVNLSWFENLHLLIRAKRCRCSFCGRKSLRAITSRNGRRFTHTCILLSYSSSLKTGFQFHAHFEFSIRTFRVIRWCLHYLPYFRVISFNQIICSKRRRLSLLREDVNVGVQGKRNAGVSETFRHHLGGIATSNTQTCRRVSEVMKSNVRQVHR